MTQTQQLHFIESITGTTPDGKDFWAYLAIPVEKHTLYKAAVLTGGFDLEEYGTVLAYGKEETPPPEIKKEIIKKYNLSDDFENKLNAIHNLLDKAGTQEN